MLVQKDQTEFDRNTKFFPPCIAIFILFEMKNILKKMNDSRLHIRYELYFKPIYSYI